MQFKFLRLSALAFTSIACMARPVSAAGNAAVSAPAAVVAPASTVPAALAPPNLVEITPQLSTSGQPPAEVLKDLHAQGYEAVVYLAPPNVGDAVKDEALIVGSQGMTFVNIPIRFGNPTEQDFETFAAVLSALGPRKVLVHCQVNMRASSMVFLYRTIKLKQDPHKAYESVSRIWVPEGPWKTLIQSQLKKHGVNFDPF